MKKSSQNHHLRLVNKSNGLNKKAAQLSGFLFPTRYAEDEL